MVVGRNFLVDDVNLVEDVESAGRKDLARELEVWSVGERSLDKSIRVVVVARADEDFEVA